MIDGQHFFYQPVKNNIRTYEKTRKTTTRQGQTTQLDAYWTIYISRKL